jgi:hypothetical protein
MKNKFLILAALLLSISFQSCKKDNETTPVVTNPYYINFTLDGVPKSHSGLSNGGGTSSGSSTDASFFTLKTNIGITIRMDKDSIVKKDLDSLIGKKIVVGQCQSCPTSISLDYEISGDDYRSYETDNPFPANYFKVTSVTYYGTEDFFGRAQKLYTVEGEFNANISYGPDVKNAKDGKFKLVFREAKFD